MDGVAAAVIGRLQDALPAAIAAKRVALGVDASELPDPQWIDLAPAVDGPQLQIDLSRFPQVFLVGTDDARTRSRRSPAGDWFKGTYHLSVISYVLGPDDVTTTVLQQRYATAVIETLLAKPYLDDLPNGQSVELDANSVVNRLSDLELQSDYVAANWTQTTWTSSEVLAFGPVIEVTPTFPVELLP